MIQDFYKEGRDPQDFFKSSSSRSRVSYKKTSPIYLVSIDFFRFLRFF